MTPFKLSAHSSKVLNSLVTMKEPCFHRLVVILLLHLLAAAAATAPAASPRGPLVGGWKPIEDPKDPHVQEIGKYAVTEYNKQSKKELNFQEVVKGETQVVSGTNYRLVLTAKDGKATNTYEAVVWEKSWVHYRNLTSFKPVKV